MLIHSYKTLITAIFLLGHFCMWSFLLWTLLPRFDATSLKSLMALGRGVVALVYSLHTI